MLFVLWTAKVYSNMFFLSVWELAGEAHARRGGWGGGGGGAESVAKGKY